MKLYEAVIPLKLPDLNTYNTVSRTPKSGLYLANALKQKTQFSIMMFLPVPREKLNYPVDVTCFWSCRTKKRDPDNIAFAVKFIFDAMVKKGILENDGMQFIKSISHHFELNNNDSVKVILSTKEENYE